uniref:GAG-pre-integrase domain-containing protein n=1 Tax=Tanacetum cinerariifolium TaxID=118510 RepID=A0A6L2N283_TANCI|nr:hypothetical protein [Tanacetum cinerariifolium]
MAQPDNYTQLSYAFKTFFKRETLIGVNFNDWYRSLRIVLRVTDTYDYLYKPCPDQPIETALEEDKAAWKAKYKKHNDVACLMLGKMLEIYDLVDALHSCKQALGKSVSAHVLEMKGYMDKLHALGKPYDNDMSINLINRSLNKDFGDFVRNFNMRCVGKIVTELHALLIDYEKGLKDKAPTPQNNNNSIFSINKKRKLDLDSSYLWHCRLTHIGKTRMQKLQREGLLECINDE